MKKILCIVLFIITLFSLCGCAKTPTGSKMQLGDQFIVIDSTSGGLFGEDAKYMYDRNTNIVYLYTCGGYHATMCPYYVIVDGAPQVAIYGETYK